MERAAAMGSRQKDDKPFAFFDPEGDREAQRPSPRTKSPRAQPSNHPSFPASTSPRDQPFGHYDPDLDRDAERLASSHDPEPRPASRRRAPPLPPSPHSISDTPSVSHDHNLPISHGQDLPMSHGQGFGGRGGYGDGEVGYGRIEGGGGGKGQSMGDGRYVYGGLRQPGIERERAGEYDGVPPPPIGSDHAHEAYASVFSDPVYGGADQVNARAGYAEEPRGAQQVHHKEDVLRHPDQF